MSTPNKPIKRSPALVEFSKDHHFGLLLVWKIRQGLRTGIAPVRISRYVSCSYVADLAHHFADEELFLFTQLEEENPLRIRAEKEHEALRTLVRNLNEVPGDEATLKAFSDLLEQHIRFEERELFNKLQATLSAEALLTLLTQVPARPHLDDKDWQDHFWVWKKEAVEAKSHAG